MIRGLVLGLALLCAPMALAQQILPALHDVTGVAVGDVLNIRAAPNASAAIVGTLPRNAKGVEVVAVDAAGKWATVNTDEGSGYASLRYLTQQDGPDWGALATAMVCFSHTTHWELNLDFARRSALLFDPSIPGVEVSMPALWQSSEGFGNAAVALENSGGFEPESGLITFRGERCKDEQTGNFYGIAADLYWREMLGTSTRHFSGCCSLTP